MAEEIYGELVTAITVARDLTIVKDEIQTLVLGLVHITDNPVYSNGPAVGEGCVTLRGFVAPADLARFEPVALQQRECMADPDTPTRALRMLTENTALLNAIRNYDRRLAEYADSAVMSLARRVREPESGFLAGTETYCVALEVSVIPIEVDTFLLSGTAPVLSAVDIDMPQLTVKPSFAGALTPPKTVATAPAALVASAATTDLLPTPATPTLPPVATPTARSVATAVPGTNVARPEAVAIASEPSYGPLLPAPRIFAPPAGATHDPLATVPLLWQSVKEALADDELYLITILFEHDGVPWVDYAWTRSASWSFSQHRYLLDIASTDRYLWSVKLIRQTSADARGVPQGVDLSNASEPRERAGCAARWARGWCGNGSAPPAAVDTNRGSLMTAYAAYKQELVGRFWEYKVLHFQEDENLFERPLAADGRPPVFLSHAASCNVLVDPSCDPDETASLLALVPTWERHRWFGSMTSSQALAQTVFGNLAVKNLLPCLADLRADDGELLFENADLSASNFAMEYKVGHLGEPRATSLDGYLGGTYHVATECKFMEAEIGTCSRPRLTPKDSNYANAHCSGDFALQQGRGERCALAEAGVLYWRFVPKLFKWRDDIDHAPCPLNANYQLVRNILAVCTDAQENVAPEQGHAVLIYDERNPAFQDGGRALAAYEDIRAALHVPAGLRKCSWQRLIAHL